MVGTDIQIQWRMILGGERGTIAGSLAKLGTFGSLANFGTFGSLGTLDTLCTYHCGGFLCSPNPT